MASEGDTGRAPDGAPPAVPPIAVPAAGTEGATPAGGAGFSPALASATAIAAGDAAAGADVPPLLLADVPQADVPDVAEEILRIGARVDELTESVGKLADAPADYVGVAAGDGGAVATRERQLAAATGEVERLSLQLDKLNVHGADMLRDMRRQQLARLDGLEARVQRARGALAGGASAADASGAAAAAESKAADLEGKSAEADTPTDGPGGGGGGGAGAGAGSGGDDGSDGDPPDVAPAIGAAGGGGGGDAGATEAEVSTQLAGVREFVDGMAEGIAALAAAGLGEGESEQLSMMHDLLSDALRTLATVETLSSALSAEEAGAVGDAIEAERTRALALQRDLAAIKEGGPGAGSFSGASGRGLREADDPALSEYSGVGSGGGGGSGSGADPGGDDGSSDLYDPVATMSVHALRQLLRDNEIPFDDITMRDELEERARIVMPAVPR